jgi:hypothetical protein
MKQLVQKYLPVAGGAGTPWENLTKPEDQKVPF